MIGYPILQMEKWRLREKRTRLSMELQLKYFQFPELEDQTQTRLETAGRGVLSSHAFPDIKHHKIPLWAQLQHTCPPICLLCFFPAFLPSLPFQVPSPL